MQATKKHPNTKNTNDDDVIEESDLEIISDDEFICKNIESFFILLVYNIRFQICLEPNWVRETILVLIIHVS